jgi:hypothetical protein
VIIWFAALIPLIGAGAIYWIWNQKVLLWEAGVMVAVPMILIACAKGCSEYSQTKATEYWGGYVTSAAFFEDWNEKVSCRHPIPCRHPEYSTDSKGKRYQSGYKHSNDGYEHLYDVDYHPEYWEVHTSVNETREIARSSFENLCVQFGNRIFINLHRDYHTKNGNKYLTTWGGEAEKLEPVTVARSYENRVQASKSVFNFKEVNPQDYNLFEHPKLNGFSQQCTMGPGATAPVEKKFQYMNATLGAPRQVRLYVLVFQNQPIQAAMEQEAYWKRGNKNEFVTCVGVDKDLAIKWAHVFSWTEIEELKIEARNQIMGMKTLDLLAYADWLRPMIESKWVRKNFEDFNYLSVEPTMSAVIWTFVMTIIVTIGIGAWAVLNPFEPNRGFDIGRMLG